MNGQYENHTRLRTDAAGVTDRIHSLSSSPLSSLEQPRINYTDTVMIFHSGLDRAVPCLPGCPGTTRHQPSASGIRLRSRGYLASVLARSCRRIAGIDSRAADF